MRIVVATGLAALVFGVAEAAAEVDFAHEIVSVLRTHCAECHSGDQAQGGFSINTRELMLESGAAEPGDADASYFLELIQEADPDYQMPPSDKPRVPAEQVALLRRWVDDGMAWTPGFRFGGPVYTPPLEPRRPALPVAHEGRDNPVDRLLDAWLAERGFEPPPAADDATFLRRASLDLTGLAPTPERVRAFLADKAPDKRVRLVEELLSDDQAYTEHWLTFWNDLLRNDYDGTGFITKGRTQITRWLYDSLRANKPFDAMVRELVAPPAEESAGFINGIKWRGAVSAAQTIPVQFSQSLSQSLLGINMKCASCHDSFVDRWKLSDAYGLAAIYADEPVEMHRCDKPIGQAATPAWVFPEIGDIDSEAPKEERLRQLAELMTHPRNGRVPRTIVNRLWGQLMGRGLVHPLDAMETAPWNADLLDWLAADFQEHGYDLKHTLRVIATSAAYQSLGAAHDEAGSTEAFVYDGPQPKRLTAEQFVDAVWRLCDTAPKKWDAGVERGDDDQPPRASLLKADELMRALGRPNRDQIVTSRPSELTTLEAVNLATSDALYEDLAAGAERLLAEASGKTLIDEVYQRLLSRNPTAEERRLASESLGERPDAAALADLLWALAMTPDFLIVR